ncbi:MAG: 50S ribosome-binding GTPase, partial [Gammaproteobacteria bacterium]|nr:50S ribosome-binding GTPase [Gammaproteobacteria bacterium]
MPANLTADYRKSEAAYRQARDPAERLACLKEMLRTIPKHKGTDHLQADIKTRIKELTADLSSGGKGAQRHGPVHAIRHEGAAQVALLGPPNSGKSSLHARLTGSHTPVGPYPLTTHEPIPGMLPHEDALLQLIDLPAISADYMEPWIVNALQPADGAMLVIDIADPDCVDQVPEILEQLGKKKVYLTEHWPGAPAVAADGDDAALDPFRIELATVLVANKSDLDPEPDDVRILEELIGVSYPTMFCSAETGEGCEKISPFLFEALGVVRVYTKSPGKPFERDKPFTVRRGDTIHDVARLVHKDFAQGLRYARVWGEGVFDGQQVGTDHVVSDG